MSKQLTALITDGLAKCEAFDSLVPERPLAIVKTNNHLGDDRYEEVFDLVGLDDAGSPCWQIADFGATKHPSNEAAVRLMKWAGTHLRTILLALQSRLDNERELAERWGKAAGELAQSIAAEKIDGTEQIGYERGQRDAMLSCAEAIRQLSAKAESEVGR